jgi:hypothetical protein
MDHFPPIKNSSSDHPFFLWQLFSQTTCLWFEEVRGADAFRRKRPLLYLNIGPRKGRKKENIASRGEDEET